jgi:hypothetical protein
MMENRRKQLLLRRNIWSNRLSAKLCTLTHGCFLHHAGEQISLPHRHVAKMPTTKKPHCDFRRKAKRRIGVFAATAQLAGCSHVKNGEVR